MTLQIHDLIFDVSTLEVGLILTFFFTSGFVKINKALVLCSMTAFVSIFKFLFHKIVAFYINSSTLSW